MRAMRLLGRRGGGGPTEAGAAPEPDGPLYVVGDVHGHSGLLRALLRRLDSHWEQTEAPANTTLVMLGNYIDRGGASSRVLADARRLTASAPGQAVCLMGSHERMMLDFLDDPARRGPRWLRNGGRATMRSFGHHDELGDNATEAQFKFAADALRKSLGDLEVWIRALPLAWQSGNVVATHAGADPEQPMERQNERALLWGHPDFERKARSDGLWVIRGHIPVAKPKIARGRISIDTGAGYGGPLTAASIRKGRAVEFIDVVARRKAPKPQ